MVGAAGQLFSDSKTRVRSSSQAELVLNSLANVWSFTGGAATNWYLPLIAGPNNNFTVKNRGTDTLTIAPSGADQMFDVAPAASIDLLPGDAYTFYNDKAYWLILSE